MNKNDYLKKLSRELSGYFKKRDIKNILADYEEYFEAGISEGKSEEEICENFGDVKTLVKEIADNQNDAVHIIRLKNIIAVISIAVIEIILFVLSDVYINANYYNAQIFRNMFVWTLITTAVSPVLICVFIKLYKKSEIYINEKVLFAVSVIPFVWGIVKWVQNNGLYSINQIITNTVFYNSPEMTIKSIDGNMYLAKGAVITIILLVITASLREKTKIQYTGVIPLLFVITGSFHTINNIGYVLTGMRDPISAVVDLLVSFVPAYIGIIYALTALTVSFLRKRFFKSNSGEGGE